MHGHYKTGPVVNRLWAKKVKYVGVRPLLLIH